MKDKWPKRLPDFSEEQIRMKDDFMHKWLDDFPKKYGMMEVFNQNYPSKMFVKKDRSRKKVWKTIELGGGLGSHIPYEDLENQEYTIMDG